MTFAFGITKTVVLIVKNMILQIYKSANDNGKKNFEITNKYLNKNANNNSSFIIRSRFFLLVYRSLFLILHRVIQRYA